MQPIFIDFYFWFADMELKDGEIALHKNMIDFSVAIYALEGVRKLGRGECSRSATGTGAYNAMRSEEYVDGGVW